MKMLPEINKYTRQTVPASHITIGLQCGGSDGFSGLTANPRWARRPICSCATAAR